MAPALPGFAVSKWRHEPDVGRELPAQWGVPRLERALLGHLAGFRILLRFLLRLLLARDVALRGDQIEIETRLDARGCRREGAFFVFECRRMVFRLRELKK